MTFYETTNVGPKLECNSPIYKISNGLMQNNWRSMKSPYLFDDHTMYAKKLGRFGPTGFLFSGPHRDFAKFEVKG